MLHSELNALEEKNTPWINSGLKKGMRHRDAAKREAMESNDPRDWPKDKLWNTINNNIKTSKASYYCNAFSQSKSNSRKTRQTIKELTSRRTNNKPVKELRLNGSIISNSSELSNAFNDHFSTIEPRLANEILPNNNNNNTLRCFDTVFQRPYRYFSIALKVFFSLSDRYKIFTSNWLWIEICENVVLSKIDITMTTTNKNLWNW